MISEIKKGFLLGIGFIIPLAIVEFSAIKYSIHEMTGVAAQAYEEAYGESDGDTLDAAYNDYEKSYTEKISLSPFVERLQGVQLLITGQFTNNSEKAINSLEIEAELFNEDGNFVYECSKSFYEKKEPGVTENYLIKCGCSKNGIPEYATAKVRVVKASSY